MKSRPLFAVLLVGPATAFGPATTFDPRAVHVPSAWQPCRLRSAALPETAVRVPRHVVAVARTPQIEDRQLDVGALGRYVFAVLIQMIFVTTAFGAVDVLCYGPLPGDVQLGGPLPWQAVAGVFFALSLRSRVFSPLDNSRPEQRNLVSADDDAALEAMLTSGNYKTQELRAEVERRGLQVDRTMDKKVLLDVVGRYFEEREAGMNAATDGEEEKRTPSWMPPGVVFPIMWVLVVAPLR